MFNLDDAVVTAEWCGPAAPPLVDEVHAGVVAFAEARGMAETTRRDLGVAIHEAVTNAVRHGSGAVKLCLDVGETSIRLEVSDEDPGLPRRRPMSSDDLSAGGRGLHLIDALTTSWGAEPRRDGPGKVVWMQIGRG